MRLNSIIGKSSILVLVLVLTSPLFAAEYKWPGGVGSWDERAKWSPGGIPGSADTVELGPDTALFLNGNRAVRDMVIDFSDNKLAQIIGSGGDVRLEVQGTLRNHKTADNPAWLTVLRGNISKEGGTLGLVVNDMEATAGRLLLGQAHAQLSRALTGLDISGRCLISNGSSVEIYTNGAPTGINALEFGNGGGKMLLNNGNGGTRSARIGTLSGGTDGVVAAADSRMSMTITTLRLEGDAEGQVYRGALRDREDGPEGGNVLLVVKEGPGEQVLDGTSDYSGQTSIEGGRLVIDGDHSGAGGALTVAPGAVLAGDGKIGGPVTVSGTIAPTGDGLELAADLTLKPGARLLAAAPLRGSGKLVLDGTLSLAVPADSPWEAGRRIVVLEGWDIMEGRFQAVESPAMLSGMYLDDSLLYQEGVVVVRRR